MNRAILQREAQDFVDCDVHFHVVCSRQRPLVAQVKCMAVLVVVSVFAFDNSFGNTLPTGVY
jgi:hypothetical protein